MTSPWPSSRQASGRRAQSAGRAWEKKLDTLHLLLRPYGVAVSRCHPQVRVARDAGAVIGTTLIGEGPPDYHATVNGCSVVFDAKHTNKATWSLAELEHHQATDLDRHQAAGAICFVALEYDYRGYVLPWTSLGPLWWAWRNTPGRAAHGTASLSAAQIGRVGVAIPFDNVLGWYPPVLTLIAEVCGSRKERLVQVNHQKPRLVLTDGVIDVSADAAAEEWALPRDGSLPSLTGLRITHRALDALRVRGLGSVQLDVMRTRLIADPTSENT